MGILYQDVLSTAVFERDLRCLGLYAEIGKLLFFVGEKAKYAKIPSIWFQLEKAECYEADAVFFKKDLHDDEYIPQIYIYDCTDSQLSDKKRITQIHKNVWTGGDVPIVCVFSKTEIIILDTTKPIVKNKDNSFSPAYLVNNLNKIAEAHEQFNENLAQRLKSGTYWDSTNVDFNKNSSYSRLTKLLRKVIDKFTSDSGLESNKEIVQKFIIQCILVKYLEERRDDNNNSVFPASFFNKYSKAKQFSDVLKKGLVFDFFDDLNSEFNGGVFRWEDQQKQLFEGKQNAFNYLSKVLRGYINIDDQQIIEFEDNFSRLYSFNHIPVELISRLYEEFIIKENKKIKNKPDNNIPNQTLNDGVAYTPSHLVRLLVNEAMPLTEVPEDLFNFKILDPACGSAIFLVVAFKRLVQWWRQKNDYRKPKLNDLKLLLSSIYGVDIDFKAVQISIFSLCIALCDELSPKEIWNDLRFEKLQGHRIFNEDFFQWKKDIISKELKFDIIIGNPPFVRGGLEETQKIWEIDKDTIVEIPQNQIALKFLSESLSLLKKDGLSCLIVKSGPLLYSNSNKSINYLKELCQHFHINQIFDFTPLARNGVLWDGVDVDTAAMFVTNSKPDYNKNILHAIFRRTKANKERIYFEIDKYDLHFILRNEFYENPYIFKINLLGGGRIKNLFYKCSYLTTVEKYLKQNNCKANEGYICGKQGKIESDFMYEYETLPTTAFDERGIDFSQLNYIDKNQKFISIKDRITYLPPNIIIKENIGENKFPIYFNKERIFTFKDKLISFYSLDKNIESLELLYKSFTENQDILRLFIFITSGQLLISKNTAILKEDIMRLPVFDRTFKLSSTEKNIINDVLKCTQYFLRQPETAKALRPLNDVTKEITFFGQEFSNAINNLYADKDNSFKLTDIVLFEKENLIGALFSYDKTKNIVPKIVIWDEKTQIKELMDFNIDESLTAIRIIQYYTSNKVLFVKPNQKRYWLASIAYRDADSVLADILSNQ